MYRVSSLLFIRRSALFYDNSIPITRPRDFTILSRREKKKRERKIETIARFKVFEELKRRGAG